MNNVHTVNSMLVQYRARIYFFYLSFYDYSLVYIYTIYTIYIYINLQEVQLYKRTLRTFKNGERWCVDERDYKRKNEKDNRN